MTKSNGLKSKISKTYKLDKKRIEAAARSIKNVAYDAKEKFTDVEESVEKYAKSNPWKTMGMSILAGVIVGRIFHK